MRNYTPALAFHVLTPWFDPLIGLLVDERAIKRQIVAQLDAQRVNHVVDLGCGTGTLACMIKRACPRAAVTGVDADPRVLVQARRKARSAKLDVEFIHKRVEELEFPTGSIDCIVTSLFLHHLPPVDKLRVLERSRDWLRPGGELHVADFTRPSTMCKRLVFGILRRFDGQDSTRDHATGQFESYFAQARLRATVTGRYDGLLGTVSTFHAVPVQVHEGLR